jgi:thymidine phosphorylase
MMSPDGTPPCGLADAAKLLAENGVVAFASVVASAKVDRDPVGVAKLATVLALSGDACGPFKNAADVASTGGPSSLSTLLCPLYLRFLGCAVPKLGVVGRPAGGVDVLGCIPGYDVNLSSDRIEKVIEDCGYAHFLSAGRFAPLDALLFTYRQQDGSQMVPSLVAASLLSKKIAVGLTNAGIEIRVGPHGNMGRDYAEASQNAALLLDAAEVLEIQLSCFITDGSVPYQSSIGRGESLMALDDLIVSKRGSTWLRQHASDCWEMARVVAGNQHEVEPNPSELLSFFEENLVAQGSSLEAFGAKVAQIRSAPRFEVRAKHTGFWRPRMDALRSLVVEKQLDAETAFGDCAGSLILTEPGTQTIRGEVLGSWRGERGEGEFENVFEEDLAGEVRPPMEIMIKEGTLPYV